ncbi:phage tail assembly protein [Nostoc sp. NIES-2111]
MTDTDRVTLVRPIKVEERMITEVTIRRPKVRDLRAMEKLREPGGTDLDQGIAMAAALCNLPLVAMDEMDAEDFAAISEVLGGFLPRTPA